MVQIENKLTFYDSCDKVEKFNMSDSLGIAVNGAVELWFKVIGNMYNHIR